MEKQNLTDFIGQLLSIFTDPETSCRTLTPEDTEAMALLVRQFGEQSILSLIKNNTPQSAAIVTFLGKLYELLKGTNVRLQRAFEAVLEVFIPNFQLPRDWPLAKRRRAENRVSHSVRVHASTPDLVLPEQLAALVGHCEKLILDTEVESLLRTILNECTTGDLDPSVYEVFLLPFLASMLSTFPKRHIDLNTSRYQNFFQAVCIAYAKRYVGLKALRPTTWTRARKGCPLSGSKCYDCAALDRFLTDPKEVVVYFATQLQRRRHIEDQLKDQRKKGFLKVATKMTDTSKPVMQTWGTTSEYMLVITKTEEEWKQDLLEWKGRRATAKQNIEAIGSIKDLQPLLSNEKVLVAELKGLGLFEAPPKSGQPGSKSLTVGDKRPRGNEVFSRIHGLD